MLHSHYLFCFPTMTMYTLIKKNMTYNTIEQSGVYHGITRAIRRSTITVIASELYRWDMSINYNWGLQGSKPTRVHTITASVAHNTDIMYNYGIQLLWVLQTIQILCIITTYNYCKCSRQYRFCVYLRHTITASVADNTDNVYNYGIQLLRV